MIGSRLIAVGGARLVGALAVACLALFVMLVISVFAHVAQARSKTSAVAQVQAQLTKAQAQAAADNALCSATNGRQTAVVATLQDELQACNGAKQDAAAQMAIALTQRDRARRALAAQIKQRQTTLQTLVNNDENCAPRAMCRAVSDELLGTADRSPAAQ